MDRNNRVSLPARARLVVALAAAAALAGCSSGADVEENPVTSVTPSPDYTGPAPATDDVQSFKIEVWDNVRPDNRCGACHGTGGQAPTFARTDDVNLAYEEANAIVDLTSPADSRMVTKVAGGHNCWESSDAVCGEILTTWIGNWAGDAAGGGKNIELEAPVEKQPGASKSFPDDAGALFGQTVHPVLTEYCAGCHTSAAATSQSPFFAEADVAAAYDAAKSKINLDDPAASRFVVRLASEFHNCWSDCAANAAQMQSAVEAFANQVMPTEVDPDFVLSRALALTDGIVASGGNRYERNVIALWEFKTGQGDTAFDTSGVEPALNLTISGAYNWVGGWGIALREGKAQGTTTASRKLHDLIKGTGEYAIEAWVVPANVVQDESRIVSYSAGTTARNFTLGQTLYSYDFFNRSDATDGNGDPVLTTSAADEDLQATLQHVVANFDPVEGRSIYVNGVPTDDMDPLGTGGSIADWDDTFAFVLGNEVSGDRQFAGTFRMVAIHNRTLTPEQIVQNFDVGVGEKFFLLFGVSHLIDVPEAYVLFEVAQFDSYSYLFTKPHFISLDDTATWSGIALEGMRIGLNGGEPVAGQAYKTVSTTLSSDAATADLGQPLADVGTIIELQKGPESDEFFLTFEVLGANTNVRTEPTPLTPAATDREPSPDVGVRVFDELNASMSQITGVPMTHPDVVQTFETVKQQLPTVESFGAFSSSQQVGVSQLAIEYCNALVEDTGLRAQVFPGFNFDAAVTTAYGTPAARDQLLDPLITRINNTNVVSQPHPDDVKAELNSLIDRLTVCGGSCEPGRTETVAKATCAAIIGSATLTIQ
ncbi:LamG domain-containing protein [Lentisalinibacter salinarum]|uniref:LamG domain-containing protein n=1 Tax=Lentisalinibacter salinarum TaxID=2992239 RepID=UPI003863507C